MSYTTTEKVLSLEWNGSEFVMAIKNEISNEYSYKTSPDGVAWSSRAYPENINANFVRSIGGVNTIIGGEGVDSSNGLAVINNETGGIATIKTNKPYVFYDLETDLEHPHTITFHKHVCLSVGGSSLDTVKIMYSLDGGETWNASNAGMFSGVSDIAWNGEKWVAVGGSLIATSIDGIEWIVREKVAFPSVKTIAWGSGMHRFVCGGDSSPSGMNAASSIDGIHWKYMNIPLLSVEKVVSNGQMWLAVGTPVSDKSIAYSYDGINWSLATPNVSVIGANKIGWTGDKWVVSGIDSSFNIATSVNGIEWSFMNVSAIGNIRALFAGKDIYYSDSSGVYSLDDGFRFASVVDSIHYSPASMKYLLARNDGQILLSMAMDGVDSVIDTSLGVIRNFATTTNQGNTEIKPVSIACGEGNATMCYSDDGIQWRSLQKNVFSVRGNNAGWNGEKWVAVGSGVNGWAAVSRDGIIWDHIENTELTEGYDLGWNGEKWVAGGIGGILFSLDGTNWMKTNVSENATIYKIMWSGYLWLAYGNVGGSTPVSLKSEDGVNWSSTVPSNMAVNDLSNVLWEAGYLTDYSNPSYGIDASSSSVVVGNEAWRLFDGLSTTKWIGLASGDYVSIDVSGQIVLRHYSLVIERNDASCVPLEWNMYGRNDGSWSLIDSVDLGVEYPTTGGISVYHYCVDNSLAFSQYKMDIVRNGGGPTTNMVGLYLYVGTGSILERNIQPILTRNSLLHPRKIEIDGNTKTTYYLTDLSLVPIKNNYINEFSSGIIQGLSGEIPAAYGFNGDKLVVASREGRLAYMTNTETIGTMKFDISLNNNMLVSGLSAIHSACFNTKYILLGGVSGVKYHELRENVMPVWKNTNVGDFMGTVYGVASNSPYGFVYIPNRIHFRAGEQLSVVSDKHNYVPVPVDVAISMQLLP